MGSQWDLNPTGTFQHVATMPEVALDQGINWGLMTIERPSLVSRDIPIGAPPTTS